MSLPTAGCPIESETVKVDAHATPKTEENKSPGVTINEDMTLEEFFKATSKDEERECEKSKPKEQCEEEQKIVTWSKKKKNVTVAQ